MYRDCIFDLYGTLVDIRTDEEDPKLWETLAREFESEGICSDPILLKEEYAALVMEEIQSCKEINQSEYEPEICLNRVFAILFHREDIRPDSELVLRFGRRFREASMKYLSMYDGAKEMLCSLRNAGKRVWLLSNAQRIFTAMELDRLSLTGCFDGIYISSDYGCKKPDPKFFRTLLVEQGIDPSLAIMTGNDGICDIKGAKQVGLHTLYMHSATSPVDDVADAEFSLAEPDMMAVKNTLLGGR